MTNRPYAKSLLAKSALELTPPLIRKTLLEEREFREEYGFNADASIVFGDSGISIQRSKLFDAIRSSFAGGSGIEVIDAEGRHWKLQLENKEGKLPSIFISSDEQRLKLPDFAALSPDMSTRLHSLDEAALEVNLPGSARDAWRNILSNRELEDDEVDEFHSDFRDTPIHIARSIRADIKKGESSISSLVPRSRRYFERLVGVYDGSASIRDYAAGCGKKLLEGLAGWRPYDGFLFSLLLSSHSFLTGEITLEHLDSGDLVRAFDFLENHGDRISQLGAIEVGLRVLPERPEIESFLPRLVGQIRDDDVDGLASGFRLLSALFVLVDGELSRSRLLSNSPPFYRRLASLSQAALIHRQIVRAGIEIHSFCEGAFQNRGEQYYMQSLADMRLEPRWNPDLVVASQIKADFFGRLMIAAKSYEKNITGGELHNLLLGTEPGSLLSLSKFPDPYLPGPLEGQEDSPNALPPEWAGAVEAQLRAEEVGPSSFIALVNSALIFRVDSSQAELAAKALRLGNHRLANVEDRTQLLAILNGLATVAAVSRGQALADELRSLVRRYRRDTEYALCVDEALRICLVASASRADLKGWRDYAGDWLTELAFGDFKGNEGQILHSHVRCLLHAVPELWVSCGRADAALVAYNAARHIR